MVILIQHQIVKTYGGIELQLPAFLTSKIDGGEWSAPYHGLFIIM
jgi:hypothetical protein